jgi:hypothetical protein
MGCAIAIKPQINILKVAKYFLIIVWFGKE